MVSCLRNACHLAVTAILLLHLPATTRAEDIGDVAVSLQAGDQFSALFRAEIRGLPQGGVLLLGDDGAPLEAETTNLLRRQLPEHGWSTLAIELLPIASASDPEDAWSRNRQRLSAGVEHLRGRGIQNVALVAHGTGATLAFDQLAQGGESGVTALVAINTTRPVGYDKLPPVAELMAKMELPMLDIFGGLDRVADATAKRRATAGQKAALAASRNGRQARFRTSEFAESSLIQRTGLIAYRQMRVDSADHWFSGMHAELVKRVRGWLKRHAAGVKVQL